ncbi:MAG: hypothetical protein P8Z31_05550 [Gammaproteobacteria bacterium]|jgi:hypothetical protein
MEKSTACLTADATLGDTVHRLHGIGSWVIEHGLQQFSATGSMPSSFMAILTAAAGVVSLLLPPMSTANLTSFSILLARQPRHSMAMSLQSVVLPA